MLRRGTKMNQDVFILSSFMFAAAGITTTAASCAMDPIESAFLTYRTLLIIMFVSLGVAVALFLYFVVPKMDCRLYASQGCVLLILFCICATLTVVVACVCDWLFDIRIRSMHHDIIHDSNRNLEMILWRIYVYSVYSGMISMVISAVDVFIFHRMEQLAISMSPKIPGENTSDVTKEN